ncbi:hypothetical protein Scep_023068 [Stephania cephalantha]|uniref:Tetratricopeptide repeat protein n=1 Tax=Stephania cephalantha TaxID=152367 RepID=A0AAP0FJW1_9MAGN
MHNCVINASSTDAWIALGYCYTKKRDLDQAKGCFETALAQVDPQNFFAVYLR